jgi:RNA polymerase sigma factor (sigma-70 family)
MTPRQEYDLALPVIDAVARRLMGTKRIWHEAVEDFIQEQRLKIWIVWENTHRPPIAEEVRFRSWLKVVMTRYSLNRIRHEVANRPRGGSTIRSISQPDGGYSSGERSLMAALAAAAPGISTQILGIMARRDIPAALGRLPERMRVALVMRFCEGKSLDAIAIELGLNRPQVTQLLARAAAELRARLSTT